MSPTECIICIRIYIYIYIYSLLFQLYFSLDTRDTSLFSSLVLEIPGEVSDITGYA